jgi:hypothetical protein
VATQGSPAPADPIPAPEPTPDPATTPRPAGLAFAPVPQGQFEGYWRVDGSATDEDGNAAQFGGRLVFRGNGTYLMMVGAAGTYVPQEGTWQYSPRTSILRTTSPNEFGAADTEDATVRTRDGGFSLEVRETGTVTRLQLSPTTGADVQVWVQQALQRTLQDLLR